MTSRDNSEGSWDWVERISWLLTILGSAYLVFEPGSRTKLVLMYIFLAIILFTIVLFIYRHGPFLKRQPRPYKPLSPTATLRGLLPFEDGQNLPGRDQDAQNIFTLIESKNFTYGVLSGESGCGKTSFLRAKLIPLLREHSYAPVYIPKPRSNPVFAFTKAVQEFMPEIEVDENRGLKPQILGRVMRANGKRAILIFDQFEEYFLASPPRSLHSAFISFLKAAQKESVIILISIRSDFFFKLMDLAPAIEDPTSRKASYILRNLNEEQATEFLLHASELDGTNFSVALINLVVQNLRTPIGIRPVELQLVATDLKLRGAKTVADYEKVQRADGILNSFIKQELEYTGQRQLAAFVLRTLCAPTGDAKSPQDKTVKDIWLKLSGRPDNEFSIGDPLTNNIQKILKHFVHTRIVVETDDGYNLFHDYLAFYVQQATIGLETRTERADKLLQRYVAEFKEDPKSSIPLRHYRFIKQFASVDLRKLPVAKKLIANTNKRFFYTRSAIYFIIAAVIAFPAFVYYDLYRESQINWYLGTQVEVHPYQTGAKTRIIVRSGNPLLMQIGFLEPAKGVIETDFLLDDFGNSFAREANDFPQFMSDLGQNKIIGSWNENIDGVASWVFPIVEHQNFGNSATTWLLLGFQDKTWDALSEPDCDTYSCLYNQYPSYHYSSDGSASIIRELLLLHPEFVNSTRFQRVLNDPSVSEQTVYELASLAYLFPTVVSPEQISKYIIYEQSRLNPMLDVELIFILLNNEPSSVNKEHVNIVEEAIKNQALALTQRYRALSLLREIGSHGRPGLLGQQELNEYVLLLAPGPDSARVMIQQDPSMAAVIVGAILDTGNAGSFVLRLQNELENKQLEYADASANAYLLFRFAAMNKEISIPSNVIEDVMLLVSDSKSRDSSLAVDALKSYLGERPAASQELLHMLVLTSCNLNLEKENFYLSSNEQGLFLFLLEKGGVELDDIFDECVIKVLSSKSYKGGMLEFLRKLLEHDAYHLSATVYDTLESILTSAQDSEETRALAGLVLIDSGVSEQQKQDIVTNVFTPIIRDFEEYDQYDQYRFSAIDLIFEANPDLISSDTIATLLELYKSGAWSFQDSTHQYRLVNFVSEGKVKISDTEIDGAFKLLQSRLFKERGIGEYLLFSFAAGDKTSFNKIDSELQDLRFDSAPHVRIAASKTLEMLAILSLANQGLIPPTWGIENAPVERTYFQNSEHLGFAWQYVLDTHPNRK